MPEVELRVPPDVRYVGLARLIVTAAARQVGMSNDRLEDLKIAVSEATANAMQAHVASGGHDPVVLTFGTANLTQFGVTIHDAAPVADTAAAEDLAAGWSTDGGLGLTLIRGLADVVDLPTQPGTSVHMRFDVSVDAPAARAQG